MHQDLETEVGNISEIRRRVAVIEVERATLQQKQESSIEERGRLWGEIRDVRTCCDETYSKIEQVAEALETKLDARFVELNARVDLLYNAFEDLKIGREDHVAAMMNAFSAGEKPDCVQPHSTIGELEGRVDRIYEMFEEAVQFRNTRDKIGMERIPEYKELMVETNKVVDVLKH
jgi:uncharacterized coiled-coil DUF342 family protein